MSRNKLWHHIVFYYFYFNFYFLWPFKSRLSVENFNRDTLVICPGGEFYDELGSGPLLGVVEWAEPADDPDAVLAGRRLLLLGHGAGWGERCWWSTGRR